MCEQCQEPTWLEVTPGKLTSLKATSEASLPRRVLQVVNLLVFPNLPKNYFKKHFITFAEIHIRGAVLPVFEYSSEVSLSHRRSLPVSFPEVPCNSCGHLS